MKNITLSAPEELIEQAREEAAKKGTTLNNEFREWLAEQARRKNTLADFDRVMKKISYFKTDRKYTREEMNER